MGCSQVTKKSPRSLRYLRTWYEGKKYGSFPRVAVSSLRRGHANLLCIVPILTDVHEVNITVEGVAYMKAFINFVFGLWVIAAHVYCWIV